MTFIASDGLEYENITKRLLSEPTNSARNDQLRAFRDSKLFHEEDIEAWYKAYDEYAVGCRVENFYACHAHALAYTRRSRAGQPATQPAQPAAVCAADEPEVQSGLGARGHLSPA